jgi:hypothetical protein
MQQSPTQSEFERDLAEYCPETPQNEALHRSNGEGEEEGSSQREVSNNIIGGGGDASVKSNRTSESEGTITEDEESQKGGGPIIEAQTNPEEFKLYPYR